MYLYPLAGIFPSSRSPSPSESFPTLSFPGLCYEVKLLFRRVWFSQIILVLIHNLVQLQTRDQSSSILQPRSTNGYTGSVSGPVCSDWYYQLIFRFHPYHFSAAISTSIFLPTMTLKFIMSDILHSQLTAFILPPIRIMHNPPDSRTLPPIKASQIPGRADGGKPHLFNQHWDLSEILVTNRVISASIHDLFYKLG